MPAEQGVDRECRRAPVLNQCVSREWRVSMTFDGSAGEGVLRVEGNLDIECAGELKRLLIGPSRWASRCGWIWLRWASWM